METTVVSSHRKRAVRRPMKELEPGMRGHMMGIEALELALGMAIAIASIPAS